MMLYSSLIFSEGSFHSAVDLPSTYWARSQCLVWGWDFARRWLTNIGWGEQNSFCHRNARNLLEGRCDRPFPIGQSTFCRVEDVLLWREELQLMLWVFPREGVSVERNFVVRRWTLLSNLVHWGIKRRSVVRTLLLVFREGIDGRHGIPGLNQELVNDRGRGGCGRGHLGLKLN